LTKEINNYSNLILIACIPFSTLTLIIFVSSGYLILHLPDLSEYAFLIYYQLINVDDEIYNFYGYPLFLGLYFFRILSTAFSSLYNEYSDLPGLLFSTALNKNPSKYDFKISGCISYFLQTAGVLFKM